jgi:hypothetical protein
MLLIEFDRELQYGEVNVLKYRHVDELTWSELHIDIETLNYLIHYFGIYSTYRIPSQPIQLDNGCCHHQIKLNYCHAEVSMFCCCSSSNDVISRRKLYNSMEQNY